MGLAPTAVNNSTELSPVQPVTQKNVNQSLLYWHRVRNLYVWGVLPMTAALPINLAAGTICNLFEFEREQRL